jgi:hypothetical protein
VELNSSGNGPLSSTRTVAYIEKTVAGRQELVRESCNGGIPTVAGVVLLVTGLSSATATCSPSPCGPGTASVDLHITTVPVGTIYQSYDFHLMGSRRT